MSSTFPSCSQMPIMFYHNVPVIHSSQQASLIVNLHVHDIILAP